jgi:hypothetical protein
MKRSYKVSGESRGYIRVSLPEPALEPLDVEAGDRVLVEERDGALVITRDD